MRRLLPYLLALPSLCGCAVHPPEASGPYRALNAGNWRPNADDLRELGVHDMRQGGTPADTPVSDR